VEDTTVENTGLKDGDALFVGEALGLILVLGAALTLTQPK